MNVRRNSVLMLIVGALVAPGTAVAQLSPEDIAALRERGKAEGWTFTVGESDATARPLHELCGAVEPPDWRSQATFDNRPATRDLPVSLDWRDYNGCTPIRDQGGCGSCWAFAAIGTVESMLQLNEGECVGGTSPGDPCRTDDDCPGGGTCDLPDADLSEEWLVSDCTAAGGCGGGWHTTAYEYLKLGGWKDPCGHSGAVLESAFPYTATDSTCTCPYAHPHTIFSWAVVGPEDSEPTPEQIKQAIMDHGPVSVSLHTNSAFHAYDSGVFNGCTDGEITHAVDLVGWDDTQGTEGVWILRNSWNTTWGEGGYMRIEYGCNRVGYATCYVNYSSQDCNGNTIPDRCDISCEYSSSPCYTIPGCGLSPDCNGNQIPDECDLSSGVSADCNSNTVPDECEADCNGNGEPDACDLSCAGGCAGCSGCGGSADCQTPADGIPDDCQVLGVDVVPPVPSCSAFADYGALWCDDLEIYPVGTITSPPWEGWYGDPNALGWVTNEQNHTPGMRCEFTGYACEDDDDCGPGEPCLSASKSLKIQQHDTVRAFHGYDLALSPYWLLRAYVYIPATMTGDANFIVNPDYPSGATWAVQLTMNTAAGTIDNHYGPETLPLVTDGWAEIRCEINLPANLVMIYYDGTFLASYPWTVGGGRLRISAVDLFSSNSSGFYYDDLSLFPAVSRDFNDNGVPDECDPYVDCNGNTVKDIWDIIVGTSADCQPNYVPDECDLVGGTSDDCNVTGIPDECELEEYLPIITQLPDYIRRVPAMNFDDYNPAYNTKQWDDFTVGANVLLSTGQAFFDPPNWGGFGVVDFLVEIADSPGGSEGGGNVVLTTTGIGQPGLGIVSWDFGGAPLSAGTWWISVQATGGYPTHGQVFWWRANCWSPNGSEHWYHNPGDGFGNGPDPIPASVVYGYAADMALTLNHVVEHDYNDNAVPDECDSDCNTNLVPDDCDVDCGIGDCTSHPLGCGVSADCNINGVPDECELDTDGDGTINECDADDDNDGVLDGDDTDPLDPDVCADADADTCDDCSVGTDDFGPDPDNDPSNDGADGDGDGICDAGDNCDLPNPGQADCQPNGIGDVCDLTYCSGEFWCGDCNGNGVPDDCDIAGGTSTDNNGNGKPDECIQAPIAADTVPKNRYLSFDVNNSEAVAIRVEITASTYFPGSVGTVGFVAGPLEAPEDPGLWVAPVTSEYALYSDNWPSILNVGDCEILPCASYDIRVTADGSKYSDPLELGTIVPPAPKYWADCVGALEEGVWTAPNGVVNMDDVVAAVQKFKKLDTAPPLTWVDVDGEVPNAVLNFGDIQMIVNGFKSEAYPFSDPADCP